MLGAAISSGASIITRNVLAATEVALILRIVPYSREFLKPVAAGLAAFLPAWLLFGGEVMTVPTLIMVWAGFTAAFACILLLFRLDEPDRVVWNAIRRRFARAA